MRLIEIQALENGAHRNQTIDGASPSTFPIPEGWAVIPDTMTIPSTYPFVNITVKDGVVTSMTANQEAYDAAKATEQEPVEAEPSEEDDTAAMLVDHEYRLTLLELGLTE